MLGCTPETDDMQRSLQLESQICLEMWFRFLVSKWINEDDLSLVCVDGPVNTEFFLHSSELDVKVQSSVCITSDTCSVLTSFLGQQ